MKELIDAEWVPKSNLPATVRGILTRHLGAVISHTESHEDQEGAR